MKKAMATDQILRREANMEKTEFKAILLVLFCTVMTSVGQILFKYGTNRFDSSNFLISIITDVPLIAGFIFYGLASILLIMALRNGHLSVLYPFVALSFIWVTLLSIMLFNEHVIFHNWIGIGSIIVGVSLIGVGSSK